MKNTLRATSLLMLLALTSSESGAAVYSLAAIGNATRARNSNATRDYSSDAKLGVGAAMMLELDHGLRTEISLSYVPHSIGYGSLYTEKSNWVELAVLERVRPGSFTVGAGVYVAKAVGNIKREYATSTNHYTYESLQRRTIDFGITGAVGYDFLKARGFSAFVDLRYNHGLRDLRTAETSELKFSEARILLGVRL